MNTIKFLVKNVQNDIIPQKTLHVLEYCFESFVVQKQVPNNASYINLHCIYLNQLPCVIKQVNHASDITEYLQLAEMNTICWKRSINDFTPIDCVVEGPLKLHLSTDGKNKSAINFQAVLSLKVKK